MAANPNYQTIRFSSLDVCERMIPEHLDVGKIILDATAGTGIILDWIKFTRDTPKMTLNFCEMNATRANICIDKGHILVGRDFLNLNFSFFDTVIISPPFRKEREFFNKAKLTSQKKIIALVSPEFAAEMHLTKHYFWDVSTSFLLPKFSFMENGKDRPASVIWLDRK